MATRTEGKDILGPEDLSQYERDGYFVFDPGVREGLIDQIRSDSERLYRFTGEAVEVEDGVTYTTGDRPRIMDAWKAVDSVRTLALAPKVLTIVEQIFGRKPLPFQTLNFMLGTEQPPHMDSMAFYSDPPDFMCGVWVALEDMDMENGPLIYFPGSHNIVRPASFEEIGRLLGKQVVREDYPDHPSFLADRRAQWHQYCGRLIEQHSFEPAYGTIKKGQALLWAPNLLHGGSPQRDKNRTRHSQVTHYFFEGCRHYSPVRTEGEHIFWDYKDWIREPPVQYGPDIVRTAVREHVPAGAMVLMATERDDDELLGVDGFDVRRFPVVGTRETAVAELERMRSDGARCAVFPKPVLWRLENELPELQDRLESNHRALLRDGGTCAIYSLE